MPRAILAALQSAHALRRRPHHEGRRHAGAEGDDRPEITDTLVRVLGKRPDHTHVVIDEVDPENWGYAGMLTTEYRKRQA